MFPTSDVISRTVIGETQNRPCLAHIKDFISDVMCIRESVTWTTFLLYSNLM